MHRRRETLYTHVQTHSDTRHIYTCGPDTDWHTSAAPWLVLSHALSKWTVKSTQLLSQGELASHCGLRLGVIPVHTTSSSLSQLTLLLQAGSVLIVYLPLRMDCTVPCKLSLGFTRPSHSDVYGPPCCLLPFHGAHLHLGLCLPKLWRVVS